MKNQALAFLLISGLFVSCSNDDDNPVDKDMELPTITLQEPHMNDDVQAGKEMHLEAIFEDNVALATYNVTFHTNFDGHTHARTTVVPFTFDKSYSLEGVRQEVHEHIAITSDATAGPYHLVVKAIDKAGNATSFADGSNKEVEIWILNETMPIVTLTNNSGEPTTHYHVHAGESFQVYGKVASHTNSELTQLRVQVLLEGEMEEHSHGEGSGHSHRIASGLTKTIALPAGVKEVVLQDVLKDQAFLVSQAMIDEAKKAEKGIRLRVVATDASGNMSRAEANLFL